MLKSIGIVVGCSLLAVVFLSGQPTRCSRGCFRAISSEAVSLSNNTLLASTALFVVVSILRALVAHLAGELLDRPAAWWRPSGFDSRVSARTVRKKLTAPRYEVWEGRAPRCPAHRRSNAALT